jgi:hypothetical protein
MTVIRDIRFLAAGPQVNAKSFGGKTAMSFVHPIIVGHFDLAKSNIRDRVLTRRIDEALAEKVLAKYELPDGEEVWFRDGYLECRCTLFSESMMGFVRTIAEREDCYAIEVSQWEILHRPTRSV